MKSGHRKSDNRYGHKTNRSVLALVERPEQAGLISDTAVVAFPMTLSLNGTWGLKGQMRRSPGAVTTVTRRSIA
jgi:hypothetical protein